MISKGVRLGDHIIHIDFDLLMHHIMEQGYHDLLLGRIGILQTEWHGVVGISSQMSVERYLGFVLFSHLDLIITWESIHKEKNILVSVINQGIDIWQRKIVLRAGPIQISIINAYMYFPIFRWHANNVGNPIRVGYGGTKSFQLLFHFFFDLQDSLLEGIQV